MTGLTEIVSFLAVFLFAPGPNPPGTVRVKEWWVDRTEIQNIHWLEYVHHAGEGLDSLEFLKLLPDSSNFWYQAPSMHHQPVVLISYEQALGYCAWRSRVVTENFGKKVTYRLPTEAEWNEIAAALLTTAAKEISKELEKTKRLVKRNANTFTLLQIGRPKQHVYHLFDNVSEMVLEKGIAKGGNNLDLPADLTQSITIKTKYKSPNPYLGFRCIAVVAPG